ncbi:hypothetical protein PHYSODRAFT_337213 [Phytophthora sojae]|uniref:Uncharacterized protein n=1 Tax=Phytophthora sojae (strain P6497) TaxID=1094619 RepID=G4ZZP5_PHYSP|nr:hypothetical protein PHYSODRAFT_337213 [Phytophthora sojae]EGZ10391.1 hypothetical protein PHYSODRAFT_337213 [Phytophthora sojae]|eukprot:XP_009533136.1 hypothetical protein PHYSODRAFT_337213 [Phytophthora sojae]
MLFAGCNFRNPKGSFGGWRSFFGGSRDADKQSLVQSSQSVLLIASSGLVSPDANERNGLLADKGDKPEGGKPVKVTKRSLQPIGGAVGSDDDDEEEDVLDVQPPEIV